MKRYAVWVNHKVIGYIDVPDDVVHEVDNTNGMAYLGFDEKTNPEKYVGGANEKGEKNHKKHNE